jgi:uncharacterized protein YraI
MLSFIPLLGKLLPLALVVIGFIICFKIWRNNNGGRIIKIVVFCIASLVIGNFGSKAVTSIKGKTAGKTTTVTATAAVTSNVNFRKGPSTDNDIIRQLPQGETVTLTGETSGGWTQVMHNGDTGWVSSEFLGSSADTAAPKSEADQSTENAAPQPAQGSQQAEAKTQTQPSAAATVTIVNETGYAIKELFIAPAGSENWGTNLFDRTLDAGTKTVQIPETGAYDIKINYTDGDTFTKRNVSVMSSTSVTFVHGDW